MLEAMASGLPIVASPIPAHLDIVENEVTGLICDSAENYAQAIASLTNTQRNTQMGHAARARVQRDMGTWDDCAARYLNIYRELMKTRAQ
jgi:glycosyltransferase involved in cell wall biosynthesis